MEKRKAELIVALDFPTWEQAEKMVKLLPEVIFFKVGLELYLASQGQAVEKLRALEKEVFLDLKFHDIPNTVAQAARQGVAQGAAILDVHALGGRTMLEKAAQAVAEEAQKRQLAKPLLLAITVLTSMNENDLAEVGLPGVEKSVTTLARLTQEAGLDGVVASPQEIALIRKACGPNFKILCPGVRPTWAQAGDQKRIMTPQEAVELGADFLVVGRPITQAPDPREAARLVLAEIEEGLA